MLPGAMLFMLPVFGATADGFGSAGYEAGSQGIVAHGSVKERINAGESNSAGDDEESSTSALSDTVSLQADAVA